MNRQSTGERLKYSAVWAAVASLGVLGILYFVGRVDHDDVRSEWPTVEGSAVSSSASTIDFDVNPRTNVHVRFTYLVEGQRFSAEQRWTFNWAGVRAKEIEMQFSPGTPLTVYYDPSDPTEAVVRLSSGWSFWWLLPALVSGVVGLLGATGSLVFFLSWLARPASNEDVH